jgi:hypothetical protein
VGGQRGPLAFTGLGPVIDTVKERSGYSHSEGHVAYHSRRRILLRFFTPGSRDCKALASHSGDQPFVLVQSFYEWYGRDSAVGVATGYGLDGEGVGVRVPEGASFPSSPCRPDRFWGPPSLLSIWYRGLFSRGKAAGS